MTKTKRVKVQQHSDDYTRHITAVVHSKSLCQGDCVHAPLWRGSERMMLDVEVVDASDPAFLRVESEGSVFPVGRARVEFHDTKSSKARPKRGSERGAVSRREDPRTRARKSATKDRRTKDQ